MANPTQSNPQLECHLLAEQLVENSQWEGECLVWTGVLNTPGYGQMYIDGKYRGAHRVAYEIYVGPIPPKWVVHHECRNPRCVNVDHLVAMSRRNHNALHGAERSAAETCLNGHPRTPENLIYNPNGSFCRTCHNNRQRAIKARARAAAKKEALA